MKIGIDPVQSVGHAIESTDSTYSPKNVLDGSGKLQVAPPD